MYFKPMFFDVNNHFDYTKVSIVTAVVVIGLISHFDKPTVHDPASGIEANGKKEVVVKAGTYESHYSLGRKIDKPFLVAAIHPQERRDNPFVDFHSQFVTFTPKATQTYMKKYTGMTHCPASFLNRYAEHISLYAANPQIAQKLATLKQKNGSEVSRWDVMNVTGQCLGNRIKIKKNGEDVTKSTRLVTLGRKASRDCHMIYVTKIEQAVMPLYDYIRG